MDSGAAFVFVSILLFFFHGYGFGGTRSHAGHTENAVFFSDGHGFLCVWIFRKVLKFEDVDRTNLHAYSVTVAFGPINLNLWHFNEPPIIRNQCVRDFNTLRCCIYFCGFQDFHKVYDSVITSLYCDFNGKIEIEVKKPCLKKKRRSWR